MLTRVLKRQSTVLAEVCSGGKTEPSRGGGASLGEGSLNQKQEKQGQDAERGRYENAAHDNDRAKA